MMRFKKGDIIKCPYCGVKLCKLLINPEPQMIIKPEQFKFYKHKYKSGEKFDCYNCGLPVAKVVVGEK